MSEETESIHSKLTPEEKKQFDDALRSMLSHLDQSPALSAQLCLLRCLPAEDCLVEIRTSRYLTAVEWEGVVKHLEILRSTQRVPRPATRPRPAKKKRARP